MEDGGSSSVTNLNPAAPGTTGQPSSNFLLRYAGLHNPGRPVKGARSATASGSLKKIAAIDLQNPGNGGDSLQSSFYEWSCDSFSRPLLKDNSDDETSPAFTERLWRLKRNKAFITEAKNLVGEKRKIEDQIAILDNETAMISLLEFHPFESIIVVADNTDSISIWNWIKTTKLNKFSNTNPKGTRVSDLSLINAHDLPLLLTAADDGIVRIWRGYDQPEALQLVSAWRALPDLARRSNGPGMIVNWQQQHGKLATTGDIGVIRIWDMERELSIQDLSTGSTSCVTCLTSQLPDTSSGGYLVAGCGDGSVRVFDSRTGRYGPVVTFTDHKDWVVNVAMTTTEHQLLSGTFSGDIRVWDVKKPGLVLNFPAGTPSMTAMAVHPYAPILASGSPDQRIKIFDFEAHELNQVRYHDGFLGQRIGPISCLEFHPYKLFLAAGATDGIINILYRTLSG